MLSSQSVVPPGGWGAPCLASGTCRDAETQRIANWPPAQPVTASTIWMTKEEAISAARSVAMLTDESDRPGLPAAAELVTGAAFNAAENQGADTLIDPARPVWVVTVHGRYVNTHVPPRGEGYIPNPLDTNDYDAYTVVIDAPSHTLETIAAGASTVA